jgi:hypothetical protein
MFLKKRNLEMLATSIENSRLNIFISSAEDNTRRINTFRILKLFVNIALPYFQNNQKQSLFLNINLCMKNLANNLQMPVHLYRSLTLLQSAYR